MQGNASRLDVIEVHLGMVKKLLTLNAVLGNKPVALWGPPGIGKTAVVNQLAEELKGESGIKNIYDVTLSLLEPSDLGGIPCPIVEENRINFMVSDILPFDQFIDLDEEDLTPIFLFFDEFDRSSTEVQNACLKLIMERQINGHRLHKNVRIILAGNATTDMGTTPLSKAAANRICHFHIESKTKRALESYLTWAAKNGVSPTLRAFAKFKSSVWFGESRDDGSMAYPSPRSFDNADEIIRTNEMTNLLTEVDLKSSVAGYVGAAAANEYMIFRSLFQSIPNTEQILADPDSVDVSFDNPGVLYAISLMIAHHFEGEDGLKNIDQIDNAVKFFSRYPSEPRVLALTHLMDSCPTLVTRPCYHQVRKQLEGSVI